MLKIATYYYEKTDKTQENSEMHLMEDIHKMQYSYTKEKGLDNAVRRIFKDYKLNRTNKHITVETYTDNNVLKFTLGARKGNFNEENARFNFVLIYDIDDTTGNVKVYGQYLTQDTILSPKNGIPITTDIVIYLEDTK